jgi:hypothetical protein
MHYSIKQLSNQRWGIYLETKLLATLGCYDKCLTVLELLQSQKRTGANKYKVFA